MLSGSLSLVEALESTIMTLVKSPVLMNRDVMASELCCDCVICHDSAGKDRGVSNVELISALLKKLTSVHCLLNTVFSQLNIGPASEAVLLVPGGLTVAHKDDLEDLVSRVLLQHF